MGISPEWNVSMVDIHLQKRLSVHRPRHAGVKGNDRVNRLAGKAAFTSGLLLGRSEVLRSLKHYLRAQNQGHHTIDRLEERGVERGSARRSSLKGRERAIIAIRRTLEPFQRQRWGNFLEMGWDAYWLFRVHRYHAELNWIIIIVMDIFHTAQIPLQNKSSMRYHVLLTHIIIKT